MLGALPGKKTSKRPLNDGFWKEPHLHDELLGTAAVVGWTSAGPELYCNLP